MDVYTADLHSSSAFQSWYLAALGHGMSPDRMVDDLEAIGSVESHIRALSVAYWSRLQAFLPLVKTCVALGDIRASELVKGFTTYRRSILLMKEGGPHMGARLSELLGALHYGLKQLTDLSQDDLTTEAQIGLLIPLSTIHLNENKFKLAIEYASQALFLAEQLDAPVSIARARTTLIACYANAGYISSAATLIHQDRIQAFQYDRDYTELQLISCLALLGNIDEATLLMQGFLAEAGERGKSRGLVDLQRMNALWGRGGLEDPEYPTPVGSVPAVWMIQSLRGLMRAYGTPREGKGLDERQHHFAEVIASCRAAESSGEQLYQWHKAFSRWAKAVAHLGRGEYAEAAGILEQEGQIDAEWLDIRVLLLGAGLELALSWYAPEELSVARFEHALRAAFSDAEQFRYASPAGLAKLLQRWHPNAAAYLALMPAPLQAIDFATSAMLKVGQVNYLGDTQITPVYACDLTLRALDFDLRRDFQFVQGELGSWRSKKKAIMQKQVGEVITWQLPVSAIKIAAGLLNQQKESYRQRAEAVLQTYGICPVTTALYPMIGIVEDITHLTKELMGGYLTPRGFTAKMRGLGTTVYVG